jgi:hypothetical protein
MKMHRTHMWLMGGAATLVVLFTITTGGSLADTLPLILVLGGCSLMMALMMRGMDRGSHDASGDDHAHPDSTGVKDDGAGRHAQ